MAVRSPHLHAAVRGFCLAAFAELAPKAGGGEIPFVLDEHGSGLYEYRPLVRDHVEARAFWLAKLPDAGIALGELRREPAAAIFAPARDDASIDRALFHAILLPVLSRTAKACGGFDWEDGAFERIYAELERSLFGASRSYAAVAPLVGLSIPERIVAPAWDHGAPVLATGSGPALAGGERPAAAALRRGGRTPERGGARTRALRRGRRPPDAPAELAAAVTALRLATGAPAAAGPVVLERLDWHPLGARPLPGLAATEPGR